MAMMGKGAGPASTDKILNVNVIVAALGYFVDIYDLLLFGIVRVASLRDIGVPEEQLMDQGVRLINAQMIGMLLGGVLWGIAGDKKGRLSVLFGSIFLYSFANVANAFVGSVDAYAFWRFVAGVGLAGELGAAITLVSETMSAEKRGYGTTIVASFGILGAVAAGLLGKVLDWKTAYIVGGVMGFALLALRVSMFESGLFGKSTERKDVRRGDIRLLFSSWRRLGRYAACILIGVPVWYVVGILITFSPELTSALGLKEAVTAGDSIMFCYAGLSIGDLASGFLSQRLRSRKKVVFSFLLLSCALIVVYFAATPSSSVAFYALCSCLGFGAGYWAVFATVAAEQFGTNLRATVATTAPNFVRGAVVPLTLGFSAMKDSLGLPGSAIVVGLISMALALVACAGLRESFAQDLDFYET